VQRQEARTRSAFGVVLVSCLLAAARVGAAEPDPTLELPVSRSELGLQTGVLVSGYRYTGGATATPFPTLWLSGRGLLGAFAVEGEAIAPLGFGTGPLSSVAIALRLGVSLHRFSITAGAMLDATASPVNLQVLPSLTAALALGPVVASLGIFDRGGLAPAHLGVSWNGLGLGWVFPLGGEVFARVPLVPHLALDAHVSGVSVFNAFALSALVGVVWQP
jgi:hypothetical protein